MCGEKCVINGTVKINASFSEQLLSLSATLTEYAFFHIMIIERGIQRKAVGLVQDLVFKFL
jgi:hypothetical protein